MFLIFYSSTKASSKSKSSKSISSSSSQSISSTVSSTKSTSDDGRIGPQDHRTTLAPSNLHPSTNLDYRCTVLVSQTLANLLSYKLQVYGLRDNNVEVNCLGTVAAWRNRPLTSMLISYFPQPFSSAFCYEHY